HIVYICRATSRSILHSYIHLQLSSLLFHAPATTEIYTLSLHDALPISVPHELIEAGRVDGAGMLRTYWSIVLPISVPSFRTIDRSEEHTSELQSRENLVCRLLLEKKKKQENNARRMINTRRTEQKT